ANDANTTGVTMNAAAPAATGTATICGTNATSVELTATTSGVDIPFWYDSPNATNPIAAGNNTTSTDITANKTYYLGVNDLKTKGGLPNKSLYENTGTTNYGAYFKFGGNFMKLTTAVPLTIESAKMYVSHAGQVSFTLATLTSINHVTGQYFFIPLYNTIIDLYATKQVPAVVTDLAPQINVPVGDNTDTGGIFNLNIPIPTPGSYILIIDTLINGAGLFVNTNIPTNPYPITVPGVFSVTGNDFFDVGKPDSATYYQKFYYPIYDIGLRLSGCPGTTRTAVVATSEASPTITLSGNILTSSAATGNQWYVSDSLLAGSTAQTDTAKFPGQYYTIVTDPITGCILQSNKITFTPSSGGNPSIGLTVAPNPSNGVFSLSFFMSTVDNTSITLTNTLGQKVYQADYPGFSGLFSQQINVAYLASGMYVLKIFHGGNTYMEKLIIRH
ncbi:MAG TPA: T9SS type A sorting domain-containing protein, partial [Puia sp.]|nr:T9SS type A sorting domain-containing protein [Puia sp.]